MDCHMLSQLHFLLSYQCIFECDHCFVYSGPGAPNRALTLDQLRGILNEARRLGTIDTVYFEGGEPFLLYPLLMACIRLARDEGFDVGIVTNAYFATSEANAELFLAPLVELGISDLSLSEDAFHNDLTAETPPAIARRVAERLGLPAGTICIEAPSVQTGPADDHGQGEPIVGGDVVFRGRAVDRLIDPSLPLRPPEAFDRCPFEDLVDPSRVHIDAFGNVQLCQGINMGNLRETPLVELVARYDAAAHPIAGPLSAGGPLALAETYDVPREAGYVDACHFCTLTRRALLDRFPGELAPRHVYGLS
jgi:hypothetical protein